VSEAPCAVVCFDCAGDDKRGGLYGAYERKAAIGKFLVFTSP